MYSDDPPHGTKQRYRRGCKCYDCREAEARYERKRVYARSKGVILRLNPIGSRRRVQALKVMGWRLTDISAEVGKSPGYIEKCMNGRQTYIYKSTADAIAAAYDRMCMKFGPSERGRKVALQRGWVPPLAWDEGTIDDPDAQPYDTPDALDMTRASMVDEVLVQRALAGHRVQANRQEKRDIIRRWMESGKSADQLAKIQGWAVHRAIREAG